MKKKLVIVIGIFILADLIAGLSLSKSIDWSSVDGIGTPVSSGSINIKWSSFKSVQSDLYVSCAIEGVSHIMSARECVQERNSYGMMAP